MGMINQSLNLAKSYGVYGSATYSAGLSAELDPLKQSFVQKAADMTSSNTNKHYMIVSLWAESPNSVD